MYVYLLSHCYIWRQILCLSLFYLISKCYQCSPRVQYNSGFGWRIDLFLDTCSHHPTVCSLFKIIPFLLKLRVMSTHDLIPHSRPQFLSLFVKLLLFHFFMVIRTFTFGFNNPFRPNRCADHSSLKQQNLFRRQFSFYFVNLKQSMSWWFIKASSPLWIQVSNPSPG